MVKNPDTRATGTALLTAMELLLSQGYSTTSVEELADASGVSRSTFFRRFGSKEDLVFADHERILSRVEEDLTNTSTNPLRTVADAALWVFDQHVGNRRMSLVRSRLLRQVETLRDRELVTRQRYERLFLQHLEGNLPLDSGGKFAAVAFASAVVAVHNGALRQWLQEAESTPHLQEKMNTTQLTRHLQSLITIFTPSLVPGGRTPPSRPAVVVTVLEPMADTNEILEAVRDALG